MDNLNVEVMSLKENSFSLDLVKTATGFFITAVHATLYGSEQSSEVEKLDLLAAFGLLFFVLLFFTIIAEWQMYLISMCGLNMTKDTADVKHIKLIGELPPSIYHMIYYILHFLPLVPVLFYVANLNEMIIRSWISLFIILFLKVIMLKAVQYIKPTVKKNNNARLPEDREYVGFNFWPCLLVVIFSIWEIIRIFKNNGGGHSLLEIVYAIIIGYSVLSGFYLFVLSAPRLPIIGW